MARPSRVFAITAAGRDRFSQLMMDTTSNQGTYQRLFLIKALHLEFVSPQDQLSLIEHYVSYCQMGLRYQQAEAQDFRTNPVKRETTSGSFRAGALELMDLISHQWQKERKASKEKKYATIALAAFDRPFDTRGTGRETDMESEIVCVSAPSLA